MLTAIGEGKKLSADYDQNQQLKGVFISTVHGRYQETNSSDVNYFIYFLFFSKENEGNRRQGQKAERETASCFLNGNSRSDELYVGVTSKG